MKKAQARADILAQDPSAPQQNQTRITSAPRRDFSNSRETQGPSIQQQYAPQSYPNSQRQASGGYRTRPPPSQGYPNQQQHPPMGYPPQKYNGNGRMNNYPPQPYPVRYPQGYNEYPPQQNQHDYSQNPQAQYSQGPRHVSHDGYYGQHQHEYHQENSNYGNQPDQQRYNGQQNPENDGYRHPRSLSYQEQSTSNRPYEDHSQHQQRTSVPTTLETEKQRSISATNYEDQAKIQALEVKIQKLEKLMTLKSSSNTSITSQDYASEPSNVNNLVEKTSQLSIPQSSTNGPPLPPPPPAEQRSISNSPKANLFVTTMESTKSPNLESAPSINDPLRLSTSSLIPTDKSISDQSIEEKVDEDPIDEPPPSYEELEKSGSLTYSKSIYRTGFEKAGYQLDHVQSPSTPTSSSFTQSTLSSKRKLPPELKDDMISKAKQVIEEGSSDAPIGLQKVIEQQSQMINNSLPQQIVSVPAPSAMETSSRESFPQPTKIETQKSKRFTDDSLYTPAKVTNNEQKSARGEFVKYFTSSSFTTQNHGVIEPILPSKSEESEESIISRFRNTRDQALKDYNQFTPKIQFFWAILLIETMSNQRVLSKMAIDGKLRKTPLSFKKLDKQRSMFLITAVKVLEKLIQIAPDETRARLYLGDIYSGGIHPGIIERAEKKGFQYFLDAALKQDDPVACYRVACCLESGVGCKQDIGRSTEFFQMGANLGDPSSMCQLGMMHFAGVNGCSQDIDKSIKYHKDAYETLRSKSIMSFDPLISVRSYQDARGALYTLAKIYQTDRNILCLNDGSTKSIRMIDQMKDTRIWCRTSRALKYYLEAAKLGHSESQASLGYYYSQGYFPTLNFKSDKEAHQGKPDPLDPRKSIYWFSKAASNGHIYASLGLARWYGSGAEGVLKKDEQQAFLWGRKAADAGELPEAEFMIGMCFETGFGITKNPIMARNYYERSASRGYRKARDKLKTL